MGERKTGLRKKRDVQKRFNGKKGERHPFNESIQDEFSMVEEKKDPPEAITVEFRVSMHCKACERSVVRALAKVKGVETITIDTNSHKAIATGQIKPEEALKKLKKKTGKRVEIVLKDEDSKGSASNTEGDNVEPDFNVESTPLMLDDLEQCMLLTMFNDENPNACYVM